MRFVGGNDRVKEIEKGYENKSKKKGNYYLKSRSNAHTIKSMDCVTYVLSKV